MWQESTQGPPRKYYTLTEDGQEALLQLDANWDEIARTVNFLKNLDNKYKNNTGKITNFP